MDFLENPATSQSPAPSARARAALSLGLAQVVLLSPVDAMEILINHGIFIEDHTRPCFPQHHQGKPCLCYYISLQEQYGSIWNNYCRDCLSSPPFFLRYTFFSNKKLPLRGVCKSLCCKRCLNIQSPHLAWMMKIPATLQGFLYSTHCGSVHDLMENLQVLMSMK